MTRAKNELLFSIIATSIVCHSLLQSVLHFRPRFILATVHMYTRTHIWQRDRGSCEEERDSECEKCLLSLSLLLQLTVFHFLIHSPTRSHSTPSIRSPDADTLAPQWNKFTFTYFTAAHKPIPPNVFWWFFKPNCMNCHKISSQWICFN